MLFASLVKPQIARKNFIGGGRRMPRKKKSNGSSENHRLSSLSSNREKPIQRNAANARERARMRVLSRWVSFFCPFSVLLVYPFFILHFSVMPFMSTYHHLMIVLKQDNLTHRAFCRLKTTLPWVPADTKLSKLDTLRLAASYIAHLKGILRDDPFTTGDSIHPAMNLVSL